MIDHDCDQSSWIGKACRLCHIWQKVCNKNYTEHRKHCILLEGFDGMRMGLVFSPWYLLSAMNCIGQFHFEVEGGRYISLPDILRKILSFILGTIWVWIGLGGQHAHSHFYSEIFQKYLFSFSLFGVFFWII